MATADDCRPRLYVSTTAIRHGTARLQQGLDFYQFSLKCINSWLLAYNNNHRTIHMKCMSRHQHLYIIVLNLHYKLMQIANYSFVLILNSLIIKLYM